MFGIFGNFQVLRRIQNHVQWVLTKHGCAPYALPVVDLCGLRRLRHIQVGSACWKQNCETITEVLFLGSFRCMNNVFALGNAVVHREGRTQIISVMKNGLLLKFIDFN